MADQSHTPACTASVDSDVEDENGGRWAQPCGKRSRFIVARTDADESYGSGGGTEEACEEHLAAAVLGMVDGDEDVSAIVTVRWNEPEGGDGG